VVVVSGLAFPTFTSSNVVSMSFSFEGSAGIAARRVDKLGLDIRSFKVPLTRSVREVVIPSIQINFHKHGRPPWPPLAEETAMQKGHARPLLLTGALQGTMKQIGIWHIDREKALIPNLPENVWYGVIHQTGADFGGGSSSATIRIRNPLTGAITETKGPAAASGGGSIPARPFAVIQPEDEEKIQEVFSDWLGERIAAAGLGPSRSL
jgi:phage gpG-like protein